MNRKFLSSALLLSFSSLAVFSFFHAKRNQDVHSKNLPPRSGNLSESQNHSQNSAVNSSHQPHSASLQTDSSTLVHLESSPTPPPIHSNNILKIHAGLSAPQIVGTLESLARADSAATYQQALKDVFIGNTFQAQRDEIYQQTLTSSVPELQDLSRALQFAEATAESGFEGALETAEATLFEQANEHDFLDFLVEEAAPQNPSVTLDWLQGQSPDLWQDAVPLVLADWASEDPNAVGQWLQGVDNSAFRDRAIAEFAPAIAKQGGGFSQNLVSQIQDEDTQQEARIRTGELDFSVLTQ